MTGQHVLTNGIPRRQLYEIQYVRDDSKLVYVKLQFNELKRQGPVPNTKGHSATSTVTATSTKWGVSNEYKLAREFIRETPAKTTDWGTQGTTTREAPVDSWRVRKVREDVKLQRRSMTDDAGFRRLVLQRRSKRPTKTSRVITAKSNSSPARVTRDALTRHLAKPQGRSE